MKKEVNKKILCLYAFNIKINEILGKDNSFDLFVDYFILNKKITKRKSYEEYYVSNFYRWLDEKQQNLRILEINIKELIDAYNKILEMSRDKE